MLEFKYYLHVVQGYFSMAQARHAMGGPSRVSSLQYDSAMSALVNVQAKTPPKSENDAKLPGKDDSGEKTEFYLEWKLPNKKGKKPSADSKESDVSVRRRNVGSGIEDVSLKPEVASGDEREGGGSGGAVVKDPLLWFGVLVPPTLRQSQLCFKQGEPLRGWVCLCYSSM